MPHTLQWLKKMLQFEKRVQMFDVATPRSVLSVLIC